MSDTAAEAAETASLVSSVGADFGCCDPVGSRMMTMLSQNATRSRKNMAFPLARGRFFSVFDLNLTGRLERPVPSRDRFLSIFKANERQIWLKLNISAHAEDRCARRLRSPVAT